MDYILSLVLLPFLDSAGALYAVLFGLLIASGAGLPVPEEVTLVMGGYLAYLGVTEFWTTVYILTGGIVVADAIGYVEGRFAGEWVYKRVVARFRFGCLLFKWLDAHFDKYGARLVFLSRPLIGVRVVVPIFAGHFRMNPFAFFFIDALAAIPWTILLVWISYHLGAGFGLLIKLRDLRHIVLAAVVGGIIIYTGIRLIRLLKHKRLTLETFFASSVPEEK